MNVEVRFEGNDVTDYTISYERQQDMCTSIATLDVTFSKNFPYTPEPWDEVILYEDGIKKGTFNVQTTIESGDKGNLIFQCQDDSLRLADTFIEVSYFIDYPSTTRYWIEKFLNEAGVNYQFMTDFTGTPISSNTTLGMNTAYDIILNLLQISGWYMFFNPSGKAIIGNLYNDTGSFREKFEDTEIIELLTNKNDMKSRNRAVVWGTGNLVQGQWVFADAQIKMPWQYDSRDVRTVLLSNGAIISNAVARELAGRILDEFSPLTYEKTLTAEGAYNVKIGDRVMVKSKYFTGSGIVNSVASSMSSNGLTTTLIIGKKCSRMFGYDIFDGYVYIGTWGSGVWRKQLNGAVWENFSAGLDDLYIRDLFINNGVFVCVGLMGYAYTRLLGEAAWTKYYHGSFVDLDENIYSEDMVRAVACTIDKITNDIYIGYNSKSGFRSWVLCQNAFRTLLYKNQIITSATADEPNQEYLALDMDRNTRENVITTITPYDGTPPPTLIRNKHGNRFENPGQNLWLTGGIPHTPSVVNYYDMVENEFLGLGRSHPYLENNEMFYYSTGAALVYFKFTDPLIHRQWGFYGLDIRNPSYMFRRANDPRILDLITVGDGNGGGVIYHHSFTFPDISYSSTPTYALEYFGNIFDDATYTPMYTGRLPLQGAKGKMMCLSYGLYPSSGPAQSNTRYTEVRVILNTYDSLTQTVSHEIIFNEQSKDHVTIGGWNNEISLEVFSDICPHRQGFYQAMMIRRGEAGQPSYYVGVIVFDQWYDLGFQSSVEFPVFTGGGDNWFRSGQCYLRFAGALDSGALYGDYGSVGETYIKCGIGWHSDWINWDCPWWESDDLYKTFIIHMPGGSLIAERSYEWHQRMIPPKPCGITNYGNMDWYEWNHRGQDTIKPTISMKETPFYLDIDRNGYQGIFVCNTTQEVGIVETPAAGAKVNRRLNDYDRTINFTTDGTWWMVDYQGHIVKTINHYLGDWDNEIVVTPGVLLRYDGFLRPGGVVILNPSDLGNNTLTVVLQNETISGISGDFNFIDYDFEPLRVEISKEFPTVVYSMDISYVPSGIVASPILGSGHTKIYKPGYSGYYYQLGYGIGEKIFDISIPDYVTVLSGLVTTSGLFDRYVGGTIESGVKTLSTTALDAGETIDWATFVTFSGRTWALETSNMGETPYIFVSTSGVSISGTILSGVGISGGVSSFYQRNPNTYDFIDYSAGLPSSNITVICLDDNM